MQEYSRVQFSKTLHELLLILTLGFIFAVLASSYNFFEAVMVFVGQYNNWELGSLLALSVYLSFGLGIFSLRRWMEAENALALQRMAEENLRKKDERYMALFEQSNDAIIISDGKKVLNLNKKGREILGFDLPDSRNLPLMSLVPEKYLPEAHEALKATLEGGSANFEMKFLKSDGELIDVEVNSSLIDRKSQIIQVVARDISSQKKAERWEQESRERLKSILDNILCGILLIEARTNKIVEANPAALAAIGISEKELMGKSCHQLICPEDEEKCLVLSPDHPADISEGVLLNSGGDTVPIYRSVVPVSIGGTAYFVESFIDLSERKRTEEELIQAKFAAEGANRAKSEFLATMSHELRTPLTAIIGFSDLMLGNMNGDLDAQNRRFLKNISSSGKHLLSLINNILDLSKIEAGKMDLEQEIFSVGEVIADTISVTTPLALKKNISVDFETDRDLFINADRVRIKQVLYNLVSNAIKFTPEEGSVKVSARKSGDAVLVKVEDTGIGISEEDLKHLFKPFKQIDSAINRHYEGTGLGLVLVRNFVEMHGGKLWVESEPGKGSSFSFELPAGFTGDREDNGGPGRVRENGPEMSGEAGETVSSSCIGDTGRRGEKTSENKKENEKGIKKERTNGTIIEKENTNKTGIEKENTNATGMEKENEKGPEPVVIMEPEGASGFEPLVLVVEDDEMVRELLVLTFTEAGYRVAQASSGKQALALAQELKPFVITLDIMMPGMNGWDVLKDLKEDSETSNIPVLVISMDDDRNCSMLWGAFDHLVKPVEKKVLLDSLDRMKVKTEKSTPRVLIVDDETAIVELMASMVGDSDYELSRAYGGREAIEKAKNEHPDALILDLMMPEVSGFDVIRALKQNPETVDIPIIVCTAKELTAGEKEILNKNVSFVMQKGDLSKDNLIGFIKNVEHIGVEGKCCAV